MVVAVKLGLDVEVFKDELKLALAALCENLYHEFVQLLGVHRLEYLILHVPCGLPQRCRNIHFAKTIPIHSHVLQVQILAELFWSVVAHVAEIGRASLHVWKSLEKLPTVSWIKVQLIDYDAPGVRIITWIEVVFKSQMQFLNLDSQAFHHVLLLGREAFCVPNYVAYILS